MAERHDTTKILGPKNNYVGHVGGTSDLNKLGINAHWCFRLYYNQPLYILLYWNARAISQIFLMLA